MLSKDYKGAASRPRKERAIMIGNILSFLSGLSIGLLLTLLVFLRYQSPEPAAGAANAGAPEEPSAQPPAEQRPQLTFDFYRILRDKEINISEWIAGEKPAKRTADQDGEPGRKKLKDDVAYVLQVGSFREFKAADRTKAELALLGIAADIQRVVANGRNIHHRVRLGPYKDADELNEIQRRLEDNNIEFILLELRLEDNAA